MSVEYYLVCHECRKRIHVAQMGFGGWAFYSGERDCMAKLSDWLIEHALDFPGHRFQLSDESAFSDSVSHTNYPEIEWAPNPRGSDHR